MECENSNLQRQQVGWFLTPTSNFPTQLGVPRFYTTLTLYLELASDPTGWVLSPHKTAPAQMPVTSPSCYLCFWSTGCESEVPTTSSLGSINLLEQLMSLMKASSSRDTGLTKDIREYEWTAQRRDIQGELLSWWSLGTGTAALRSLWFLNLEALQTLSLGFYGASLLRND